MRCTTSMFTRSPLHAEAAGVENDQVPGAGLIVERLAGELAHARR
jgi:hypothetical protein